MPRILSVATANPPYRYSQEQLLEISPYKHNRKLRDIFLNSDIQYRHVYFDIERFKPTESADELHARYARGAIEISAEAANRCLACADASPEEIDYIVACSCTGYLCPDLASRLVKELNLRRDVQRASLLGMGCAAALPALQRAYEHLFAYPQHKVLLIAVEICSAAYYLDDTIETVVGNAICADGAAAVLLGNDKSHRGPEILAFESLLSPEHIDEVGFAFRSGKLRIILSRQIQDLAPAAASQVLDRIFAKHRLSAQDIRHWILHPGGRKVIDKVQSALGLTDDQVKYSRHVLRNYGNMSSPTVLFVLKEAIEKGNPQAEDLGVMLALGPGLAAEAALLRW